jgi:hypothetical protein
VGWIPQRHDQPRRKERVAPAETFEALETRSLLADGISAMSVPPITAVQGVPLTNVVVATFTVTDPSGAPGSKWRALIKWGDGAQDKLVMPVPAGNAFNSRERIPTRPRAPRPSPS